MIAVSASTVSADTSTGRLYARRWGALVAMSLGAFMTYLDNNFSCVNAQTVSCDVA